MRYDFDFGELDKWLDHITSIDMDEILDKALREIAGRTLKYVKKNTPVGKYSKDVDFVTSEGVHVSFTTSYKKTGGTLRKGWELGEIFKMGDSARVEIFNDVYYVEWVENGHSTSNGGFVQGRFMLKIAIEQVEMEVETILMNLLEKELMGD